MRLTGAELEILIEGVGMLQFEHGERAEREALLVRLRDELAGRDERRDALRGEPVLCPALVAAVEERLEVVDDRLDAIGDRLDTALDRLARHEHGA